MNCAICGETYNDHTGNEDHEYHTQPGSGRYTVGIYDGDYGIVDSVKPRFARWGHSEADNQDAHYYMGILNSDARSAENLSWDGVSSMDGEPF